MPDHSLLDRIVRGRTWIAMLAVMLVGIVAMQVEELKLGASVGRGLSESAALQSKNQLLRATVSALADDQRIEQLAARMGMVMPAPGDVVFLTPHTSADASRAASQIQLPNPTSFLASLPQAATSSATGATGLTAGATAGATGLTSSGPGTGSAASSTGTLASTGAAMPSGAAGTTAGTTGVAAAGSTTAATGGTAGAAGAGATAGGTTAGTPTGTTPTAGTPTAGAPTGATSAGGAALAPVTTGTTTGN